MRRTIARESDRLAWARHPVSAWTAAVSGLLLWGSAAMSAARPLGVEDGWELEATILGPRQRVAVIHRAAVERGGVFHHGDRAWEVLRIETGRVWVKNLVDGQTKELRLARRAVDE